MSTPDFSFSTQINRRKFIFLSSAAAGALVLPGCATRSKATYLSPGSKLNIAVIGANGKGASDTNCCNTENIVALCDADEEYCAGQRKKYPNAKFYRDFRKMYDEMGKSIDAVIVSTPDHAHGVAAAQGIAMGKHVYCQKPLVQTVYEARLLRKMAKEQGVVTQMGNQGSAEDGLRRAVECIHAGIIGPIHQAHVWSNRPIWPQGLGRPAGEDPVPANLDWDVWLGPARFRPYKKDTYNPFKWRGWLDYGTGALGDMACHTCNMPFRALKLGYPTEVAAESSGMNGETYPLKSRIRFEFPAREGLVPVTFCWYDGGNPKPGNPYAHDGNNKPPKDVVADVEEMLGKVPGSGCLLIGEKGKVFSPDDYGARFFLKLKDDKEYLDSSKHPALKGIPPTIARNEFKGDTDWRHHQEWIKGCKGGPVPYSNFDIAAYLTEIILLGCVALRVGQKLEWDGPKMRAKNAPEAAQFVKREYRKGWELPKGWKV